MECKCDCFRSVQETVSSVLIETLWNVNLSSLGSTVRNGFVLIETLWNVNVIDIDFYTVADEVLIETLWNVNLKKIGNQMTRKRY